LTEEGQGSSEDAAVPRRTRWFVRAFLVAFIVCGLAGVEAWPFTGFRLFSHLRHEKTTTWERTVVVGGGDERAITFRGLPDGYRSFVLVVKSFDSKAKADQDDMCRDWIGGLRRVDPTVTGMRIYRLERSLLPRRQDHAAAPLTRTLVFTCSSQGVSMGAGP
jgi:hypothetical protein